MASSQPYNDPRYKKLWEWVRSQAWPCHLCGQAIDYRLRGHSAETFTLDHLEPLARGGSLLDKHNARAAHKGCNSSRGELDIDEWAKRQHSRNRSARPTETTLNLSGFA